MRFVSPRRFIATSSMRTTSVANIKDGAPFLLYATIQGTSMRYHRRHTIIEEVPLWKHAAVTAVTFLIVFPVFLWIAM